jgi:DNA repair exonuclease SbcCD ATPase subunit
MITIKSMTVKNFMSVGNQTQAVNFDQQKLTLVLGENLDQGGDDAGSRNGTGKTTIVNALSYALYGQALTNIKRNNLINKTNSKNMLVTLEFEKNKVDYRIERGRSPNVMKFYINNQEQEALDESQGDSRKTQESINELLCMTHDMFKHIVALNTYTEPFLSLRTNDQRNIIEQLLGITLLSEKALNLKEQIRYTKDAIQTEEAEIRAKQTSNETIQASINSLKTKQSAWAQTHKESLNKLLNSIKELQKVDIEEELNLHEALDKWEEHNNKKLSLQKELATLEAAGNRATKAAHKALDEFHRAESAECYACGQPLKEKKHAEVLKKKRKEYADADKYLNEVTQANTKVIEELHLIGDLNGRPNTFYETAKEAYEHKENVSNLEKAHERQLNDIDPYIDQINELKESAIQEINWDNINDLTKYKEHQEFLLKLLTSKDSFIRKKIIEQNLAYLNNRLTSYLNALGLPHQVVFLNDLAIEITQFGQDLDFDNLSRGERNRLILGLSFAFRDVWESLYENINLLFIDELIDSGMDTSGVENSLSVIKKMGRDRKKNVFLISHKDELIGRVNNVLKVIKENGFSSFANDLEIT